jgi:leucyl/phenylalanyl-tRNA--protein transferase
MVRYPIKRLSADPRSPFPDPAEVTHPEGLLAWGGDLQPERLLSAYRNGIFPWYETPPILWWSPTPRAVMLPGHFHVSRSLRKSLRRFDFEFSMDVDFSAVIDACAAPRDGQAGTWITPEMRDAFIGLHESGHAHSLEVRKEGELVGGLYGLAMGKIFFAESKFHHHRDASKAALLALMNALQTWCFLLADCQIWNPHLERLGVRLLDGNEFRAVLAQGTTRKDIIGSWHTRFEELSISAVELAKTRSTA